MNLKWLNNLEKQVEAATKELRSLRKQNASQKSKIEKLEEKLAAAQSDSQAESAWETERDEIRQRVEKLSAKLEELS